MFLDCVNEQQEVVQVEIESIPTICPICHIGIKPIIHSGHQFIKQIFIEKTLYTQIVFQCPISHCKSLFIGEYSLSLHNRGTPYYLQNLYPKTREEEINFSKEINRISEKFSTIYNHAYFAEQEGFSEVCGCGYRKALEFLVKDYVIHKIKTENHSDEDDRISKIKKDLLGKVIEEEIRDTRIKKLAKATSWVGNDETHYEKRMENKDINNLKKLIEMTVYYISMDILSEEETSEILGDKKIK